MPSLAELQSRVDDVLTRTVGPETEQLAAVAEADGRRQVRFSAFNLPDVQRAKELAAEWMRTAESVRADNGNGNGNGDGMTAAVGAALEAAGGTVAEMESGPEEDPDLGRHALMLFLTHYRHELPLRIKGLEARAPRLVLPSVPVGANGSGATPSEQALNWFREDPKLNEHHEHWHVVYPIAGVPDAGNPRGGKTKDRQGELFLYMHQQMLARYETERIAVGLAPLVPWGFAETEPLGYSPGPYLEPEYGPRLPGKKWEPTPEGGKPGESGTVMVTPKDMALRAQRLFAAAKAGYFEEPNAPKVKVDANLLGQTQEADIGTVEKGVVPWDPEKFDAWYNALLVGYYGNFHNVGHDMFGYLSTNQNGVMGFVPTATRDHVFFRWHKLIDDLSALWQENRPSHDFSADAPPVKIRKGLPGWPEPTNQSPDIILCLQRDLVPWDRWEEFGEWAFGGENWNSGFASGTYEGKGMPTKFTTTKELLTEMRKRVITIETGREDPKKPEQPHEIEYLDQEEFFYFLRLENKSATAQDVTVRVFLVSVDSPQTAEDRRMWIEMDKFKYSLTANEKAVVFRPASLSSVIRKPGYKPPTAEQPPITTGLPNAMQEDADIPGNYCDCGWPYNLLLPRGTGAGMKFRLLVMLTDWKLDNVVQEGDCGSMSYCGSRDKYPDKRPMGYPFDAPFRTQTIAQAIAAAPNMATRDITIRWD